MFGSKVREGWPEVADFNDNVMKVGLAGGTLAYRDQENSVLGSGRLGPGMAVMTKPFPMETMAARIKQMIES